MDIHQSNDTFSIATLIYARLRRVSSRVIDVMYFTENIDYARYVIGLALATHDVELHRLAQKLEHLLPIQTAKKVENIMLIQDQNIALMPSSEPTQEDISRHQVAHRYIGSLR